MKYRFLLSITTIILTTTLFAGDNPDLPKKLEHEGFRGVIAQVGNLYVSGQPSEKALAWLKSQGVQTIFNIRTPKEMEDRKAVPFDEAAKAKEMGIEYINVPQGGDDHPYAPETVKAFAEALDHAQGKVLLHCASGHRASHLYTAYLIKYKGVDLENAIEQGMAINFGSFPLEGFLGKKIKFVAVEPQTDKTP